MNSKLKKMINTIETKQDNIVEEFIQLMDMPDKKFEEHYETIRKAVIDTYKLPEVRKNILEQLKLTPIADLESEKAGLKELEDLIIIFGSIEPRR